MKLTVGNTSFCAVLDLGSEISLLRRSIFEQLSLEAPVTLDRRQIVHIEGFTGSSVVMRGAVDLSVGLPRPLVSSIHTFAVIDDNLMPHCSLLGIDFMVANFLGLDPGRNELIQVRPVYVSCAFLPRRQSPPSLIKFVSVTNSCSEVEPLSSQSLEALPSELSSFLNETTLIQAQRRNTEISKLRSFVESRSAVWPVELAKFRKRGVSYVIRNDIVWCLWTEKIVPVVPLPLMIEIVIGLHTALAHIGRDKMLHLLRQHICHPNLYMVVRDVCQSCGHCQLMKVSRQIYIPPTLKITTNSPFELVAADLVVFPRTSEGYIGCLVVVDHNSKWTCVVPIKNKTAKSVISALRSSVIPFLPRCPAKLLTDNGS